MSDLDDADYAIRAPYIQRILALEAKVAEYYALLHAVERKFEDESRYETAMRYIREAEARCMNGKASTATSRTPADTPDTAPQPPATLVSYRQKTWMT